MKISVSIVPEALVVYGGALFNSDSFFVSSFEKFPPFGMVAVNAINEVFKMSIIFLSKIMTLNLHSFGMP